MKGCRNNYKAAVRQLGLLCKKGNRVYNKGIREGILE